MNVTRIGISVGDTSGIGMEVVLKAISALETYHDCCPIIYASEELVRDTLRSIGSPALDYEVLSNVQDSENGKIYVKPVWQDMEGHTMGLPSTASGQRAFESLDAAMKDLINGSIDALVTAPIDKKNIQQEGFSFPGHTEYLAARCNTDEVLMLLVSDGLRVGVVTGHIPLSAVPSTITADLILQKARMMHTSLIKDFGIKEPRIAILGLNPHAGDGGLLGPEEQETIAPAIRAGQEEGLPIEGPFPADGFFGSSMRGKFDGVLTMYHDQGLAPFKALAFGGGVNFTAGLPIVRTSPDHGTAFDIAGKNKADGSSFKTALRMAAEVVESRRKIA